MSPERVYKSIYIGIRRMGHTRAHLPQFMQGEGLPVNASSSVMRSKQPVVLVQAIVPPETAVPIIGPPFIIFTTRAPSFSPPQYSITSL